MTIKEEIEKYPEYSKLIKATYKFKSKNKEYPKNNFNFQDIINKFGPNPICYLTGKKLDYKLFNFSLDHFIAPVNGGNNELENLKLCDSVANMMKYVWSIDFLIKMCIRILTHNGYKIEKIN